MKAVILVICCTLSAHVLHAQQGEVLWSWDHPYGFRWDDVKVAPNRDIIAIGNRNVSTTGWVTLDSIGQQTEHSGGMATSGYYRALEVDINNYIHVAGGSATGLNFSWSEGVVDRFNPDGTRQWEKRIELVIEQEREEFKGIALDDSGNCMIGGYWIIFPDSALPRVHKVSNAGDSIWTLPLPYATTIEQIYDLTRVPGQDEFVAVGMSGSFLPRESSIRLWKFNGNGDVQWSRSIIGNNAGMAAYGVAPTSDGGFAIAGVVENVPSTSQDILLAKTSAWGNLVWSKRFGGFYNDVGSDLIQLPDGGYIVIGTTNSFGASIEQSGRWTAPGPRWLVIRTNASGNLIWMKVIDSTSILSMTGMAVESFDDSTIIVAGQGGIRQMSIGGTDEQAYGQIRLVSQGPPSWRYEVSHIHGSVDTVVFTGLWPGVSGRLEGEAAFHWSVMPGGDGNDGDSLIFVASSPLSSGSIGTFVIEHSTSHANHITWVVNGIEGHILGPRFTLSSEPQNEIPEDIQLRAYPNPFNLSTTLEFTLARSSLAKVEIFDVLGRKVKEILNTRLEAGIHSISFTGDGGLPSGVYIARLQADETISFTKLLLLK